MENSFSWEASALLGMAGAWLLVGPASSRLGRFSSIAALLLFIAAVFDLWLGDRTAVAPLAPWSGALVLWGLSLDLVRAQAAPASSTSIDVDKDVDQDVGKEVEVRADESWLQGLAGLQDAIALLDSQYHRLFANLAWERLFAAAGAGPQRIQSERPEIQWLEPLLTRAAEQGYVDGAKVPIPSPGPGDRLEHAEPTEASVFIYPVKTPGSQSRPNWLVAIPNRQALDLALFTRQTSHNFNNLLSAIVGGAGMAMDLVPEGSELHRELTDIENVAMRAADLTSGLQQAAREVAPPEPVSRSTQGSSSKGGASVGQIPHPNNEP